jgi:predicted SAM-dependent methyltransferase
MIDAAESAEQRLNVGCGPEVRDGWVNVDKSPSVLLSKAPRLRKALGRARLLTPQQVAGFPPGVVFGDISSRLPVGDETAESVYSSHVIEHLSPEQGKGFVRECYRVLKPGGVLRIVTPDLELMINEYLDGTSTFLGRYSTPADAFCAEYNAFREASRANRTQALARRLFGGDFHQWLYDFVSMKRLLESAGFVHIDRRAFMEGDMLGLAEIETRGHSLYVEARR